MRSLARQQRSKYLRQQQYSPGGGVRFGGETTTFVSADDKVRPLRDQMIVEPLDVVHSRHIIVGPGKSKPLRGIVKAIGPGHYPIVYLDAYGHRLPDHARDRRRLQTWSKRFQPTELKVGDVVELGGGEIGGYAFETFWWGDTLHLHCREADVAVVYDDLTAKEAREEARRYAA